MRKNAKYMLATLLMFCFVSNVHAEECSYEKQVELNNIASTVKATYEEVEIDTGETIYDVNPETGEIDLTKEIPYKLYGFKLKILNITKDIYVTVKDDATGEISTYYYRDTNEGTLELNEKIASSIYTYSITINGLTSDCVSGELRNINVLVPMYNWYSETGYCSENPEFEYCQKFVTSNMDVTLDEFYEAADKYSNENSKDNIKNNEEQEKTVIERIKTFINDNKKIIIIVTLLLIILGVTTTVIIIKKKRSRLI